VAYGIDGRDVDYINGIASLTFNFGSIPRTFISWYISKIPSIVSTNPVQPSLLACGKHQSSARNGLYLETLALFMLKGPKVMNTVSEKVKFPSISSNGSNVKFSLFMILFQAARFSGS
jgi:hypothetical protein